MDSHDGDANSSDEEEDDDPDPDKELQSEDFDGLQGEDFDSEAMNRAEMESTARYNASRARYESEKKKLLDDKWNVTVESQPKKNGPKNLEANLLVRVKVSSCQFYKRGQVGRLVSQVSAQRWGVLFRVDGEDIEDEVYSEDDFEGDVGKLNRCMFFTLIHTHISDSFHPYDQHYLQTGRYVFIHCSPETSIQSVFATVHGVGRSLSLSDQTCMTKPKSIRRMVLSGTTFRRRSGIERLTMIQNHCWN